MPATKSKCSLDVQASVLSTQDNVLSVDPFSVIPPPSAVVSVGVLTTPSCIFPSLTVTMFASSDTVEPVTDKLPATFTLLSKVDIPVTSSVPGTSMLDDHSTSLPAAFV